MEGATSSCTSSTAATTIPCWEMEAGDASGRGWQERKSSERGEMVFLIFSCAKGLCCSAADEQDDSGMLASGSTATCRTNCATSHIASMLLMASGDGGSRSTVVPRSNVSLSNIVELSIRGHWKVQALRLSGASFQSGCCTTPCLLLT